MGRECLQGGSDGIRPTASGPWLGLWVTGLGVSGRVDLSLLPHRFRLLASILSRRYCLSHACCSLLFSADHCVGMCPGF